MALDAPQLARNALAQPRPRIVERIGDYDGADRELIARERQRQRRGPAGERDRGRGGRHQPEPRRMRAREQILAATEYERVLPAVGSERRDQRVARAAYLAAERAHSARDRQIVRDRARPHGRQRKRVDRVAPQRHRAAPGVGPFRVA